MSISSEQDAQANKSKYLGACVDLDLYWRFKSTAAERNEPLKEALINAIYMYLDISDEEVIGNVRCNS